MKAITLLGCYGSLQTFMLKSITTNTRNIWPKMLDCGLHAASHYLYMSLFSGLIVHIIKIAVPLIFIRRTLNVQSAPTHPNPRQVILRVLHVMSRVEAVNAP